MNYREWVRDELRGLSKSMGFRYTPLKEIERRISRLREAMETQGMDALLVVQKMDLYYLSGTTQDSILFIPLEGRPILMVRRELERAEIESP
ncbi:MAG: aminopeptidase P family N-terminal domain-containing protein, partial [Deltaproteobacteria bacterium]|nr:aminopeptidase P family N-terminal domain-containing protein [Deltaproteobacteria bacterium]